MPRASERVGPRLVVPPVAWRGDGDLGSERLQARAGELGLHPVALGLLRARGIEDDDLRAFLAPSLGMLRPPATMAGFEAALDLLETARRHRWRVGVFGDYDVDGVTTAALLTTYLEALGLPVVARVAHRERGYGFGLDDARALAEAGVRLVVTGDTGTSDLDALQWLRDREIPTLVIDHHQVPTEPPPASAFINPHQPACTFPFKGLCSAGVAFYLCAALRTRLARTEAGALPDPRAWLDLVAVATVCDMMPLLEENRILVRAGLRHLARRSRPGLRALMQIAGIGDDEPIDEQHVAFKLGPRLNAPGRLGPAEPSLRLLRARSDTEAAALAEQIETLNARRKRHTEQTVAEAMALLSADPRLAERSGLVVAHRRWLAGIVGIAAAQIVEHHGRPALVLAIDEHRGEARGSVRGIPGVDVRAALEACAPLLQRHGGHREAAGVTLSAARVPELVEAFDAAIAEQTRGSGEREAPEVVDGELPLAAIGPRLCQTLRSLGPFGVGFSPPRFLGSDLRVERLRVLKERHLALTLSDGDARHEAMAFGWGTVSLREGDRIGCIFSPGLDRFRGVTRLRLAIERLWKV